MSVPVVEQLLFCVKHKMQILFNIKQQKRSIDNYGLNQVFICNQKKGKKENIKRSTTFSRHNAF